MSSGAHGSVQCDETGVRLPEAAAAEVERAKIVVEVDMQPLASGRARLLGGDLNEPGADALPPHPRRHQCVQDERVHPAVPGHVDEANQVGAFAGADPAQAVLADLSPPAIRQDPMAEPFGVQGVDRGAVELAAPLETDHCATVSTDMDTAHPVIPDRVLGYVAPLADALAEASGGQFLAAYLHGSAALGGWIPGRSDVDVLFVGADDLTGPALSAVARVLAAAGSGCPGRELECSVVTVSSTREPRRPWPFLLHVVAGAGSAAAKVMFGEHVPGDRDLLMHYAVCRAAGCAVTGPPPRTLIGAIPRQAILGYLADEADWGLANAPEAYSVLNACRAASFLADNAIVSKIAGAETVLERGLGPADVIGRALRQQRGELADQRPADDAIGYVRTVAEALRCGAAPGATGATDREDRA